ncbi:hypothetical protein LSUE1_G003311 [Lachnellula suecica]|uniref:AB hydrolase-1 domain-containing protein n=1 Tax=Lachnellula suecica TaxID=602035 RepID=A0A8T9C4C0_9HELO|nr:hypothetical protein LSUE1_G003311 [Lachnellula suecica]
MRLSVLALVSGAAAQFPSTLGFINPSTHPSRGGGAVCVSGIVSVQASTSVNLKFNFELPSDQLGVTQTFISMVTNDSPFMQQLMAGTQTVGGTYDIGATLCTPANNLAPDTVEILTHGVGFDRNYWDFAPGYSYVDVAAQYNHATFFYDRLGVGESSKPDALNVVQSPLEVEILQSLINKVSDGAISNILPFEIVGVGHSFGSILTQAVTAKYPLSLNTAILTGFSTNGAGVPVFITGLNLAIASQNAPSRFNGLSNGYLVSSSAISNQIAFFTAPNFDFAVLDFAEATKGSVTIGELFTITTTIAPATDFTGSVAVVLGEEDLPFCTGNCLSPPNQAQSVVAALYPRVKASGTYLAPLTGHGINLHYSAGDTYHYIQEFIAAHGNN